MIKEKFNKIVELRSPELLYVNKTFSSISNRKEKNVNGKDYVFYYIKDNIFLIEVLDDKTLEMDDFFWFTLDEEYDMTDLEIKKLISKYANDYLNLNYDIEHIRRF